MNGVLLGAEHLRDRKVVDEIADVVIIGSGAAGATAARVLSERGLEVVVLEEGPHLPVAELRPDVWAGFRRGWREQGFQAARGRAFTPILQGRTVGGSTAFNGAIIHRTPERIHALWKREHGLDPLFDYAELERVWGQLESELSIAPAPAEVRGQNNDLFAEACEKQGIGHNAIRRNVRGCRGRSRCLQGCPTAQRQSMNISYIPQAIAQGARVYADCEVRRVHARGGRASWVEGRIRGEDGRRGPKMRARARHAVMLAASAIQTPLVLLRSGIGRASGLVGRRLQGHPGTSIMARFDTPVRMWFGATQGHESTHYWDERMKFETVAVPLEVSASRFPGFGPRLMERIWRFGDYASWGVQVRSRAHGRVRPGRLGGADIYFDASDADVRDFKLGVQRLTELAFDAGARSVLPGVPGLPDEISAAEEIRAIHDLPDDPRLFHCIISHLFGTAVLGPDPLRSVVDPTLVCHEMPGLHVIDSSVFPTNLGVNPQHSICAVAWLAAERVSESCSAAL